MRSLVLLVAIGGSVAASCGGGGEAPGDAAAVTPTSAVALPTVTSAPPSTPPPTTSLAVEPVSESELLDSVTGTRRRTVTSIAELSGLRDDEALDVRNSVLIHSCNELALVEVLGEMDGAGLVATWKSDTEVVLAGSPDALHTAFTVLAGWLDNCSERPYSIVLEEDEYEVYQTPMRTLSIGDESFMIGYGLTLRDQPFCDHKLVVVRDDDRLVVIDTYGSAPAPVLTDDEVVATATEAVARLHTSV